MLKLLSACGCASATSTANSPVEDSKADAVVSLNEVSLLGVSFGRVMDSDSSLRSQAPALNRVSMSSQAAGTNAEHARLSRSNSFVMAKEEKDAHKENVKRSHTAMELGKGKGGRKSKEESQQRQGSNVSDKQRQGCGVTDKQRQGSNVSDKQRQGSTVSDKQRNNSRASKAGEDVWD